MKIVAFISAVDGMINVSVGQESIIVSNNAVDLARAMLAAQVSEIGCSSSIEFCAEEGFANNGDAQALLDEVVAIAARLVMEV
jgi:hypothetical protein